MWSSWTAWGECSVPCGGGSKSRTRSCTSPEPDHGGEDCPAEDLSIETINGCNPGVCPTTLTSRSQEKCPKCRELIQATYSDLQGFNHVQPSARHHSSGKCQWSGCISLRHK